MLKTRGEFLLTEEWVKICGKNVHFCFALSSGSVRNLVVWEFLLKRRNILEIKPKQLWMKCFDNFAYGVLCWCSQKDTENIF